MKIGNFAIEGMPEALNFELREIGVAVKIVEPGDVLTDFKIDSPDSSSMPEYEPLVSRFMDSYAPIKALWRNVFIRHSPPFHSSTHSVKYEANAVRREVNPS